jgi:hypothetical protein
MSEWQWFMLGGMVALSPALIVLVILLLRSREGGRS